jgi:hypothetical protein
MDDDFTYDVFLSHSSKDQAVVRAVAERLRDDGLKVWFDEWLKPGVNIPHQIDEGLEHSRAAGLLDLLREGRRREAFEAVARACEAEGVDVSEELRERLDGAE